mgnify:CR=1 FL=1
MVKGLDIFAVHFSSFKDCYALIGGSACYLILADAGITPRATKDLDVVLCIEKFYPEFARAIWNFLERGGYRSWQTNEGKTHYYRFVEPEDLNYPFMLEFFSRIPDALEIRENSKYTSIPVDDEISSLSAILMNDDYYRLVLDGKTELNNISIVKAEYLIPLKIKAWMDLSDRKRDGIHVNSDDIKKHRSDVFRLFGTVSPASRIALEISVSHDMIEGLNRLKSDTSLNLSSFGLRNLTVDEVVESLFRIYQLTS